MGNILRPDSNKIRSLRIQRGWPREQLARIADVSPRTIQRMEAGGNASFETLRSIAAAFELEVHELMQQEARKVQPAIIGESSPLPATPAKTPIMSFAGCLLYVPVLKMTLSSLTVVLVISAAIRMSPFFLAYLDPETQAVESPRAPFQDSPSLTPMMDPVQQETNRIATAALTPPQSAEMARNTANKTTRFASPPIPATYVREPKNRFGTETQLTPEKSDSESSNCTIVIGAPATLSSLEPRGGGHLAISPVETSGAPGTRLTSPEASPGLADLVAEDSISVSRSFARSGKSAAAFFTKFGSSIKRTF